MRLDSLEPPLRLSFPLAGRHHQSYHHSNLEALSAAAEYWHSHQHFVRCYCYSALVLAALFVSQTKLHQPSSGTAVQEVVDLMIGVVIVGVDSLVFFSVPDAGKELVHVHGPKVLPAITQCMLELIKC
ncbi:Histidine--tRNA ligase [Gossypium arboreum]|uniref:Histidine--tRNA ligase n=1 Tax=Gossypium arboreum TaxID=29729 RepID=A0A0B0PNX1_GOSAR|nr:Histidine--tRNA ligase [Gossypium arboreum]